MKVAGTIIDRMETQQISATFRKREIAVQTAEQYPQTLLVQFTGDRCDILNSYPEGTEVEIDINLRGRSWTNPQGETKYFNTIEGWRITRTGNQAAPNNGSAVDAYMANRAPQTQTPAAAFGNPTEFPVAANENDFDDLPF